MTSMRKAYRKAVTALLARVVGHRRHRGPYDPRCRSPGRGRRLREFIDTHDWITCQMVPVYAPDPYPVESIWSLLRRSGHVNTVFTVSQRSKNWVMMSAVSSWWLVLPTSAGAEEGPGTVWPPPWIV
ncbi:hypothetical protein RKD25_008812 [Streptomyces sp. SAI-124]|nr:hypothetical protein [Streptomyces sp. SAI-090]MDH6554500.1 hypothetical protein [Streptomyces sp. SAI-041]MDH6573766.1 hypothetical protein [Streptomyces sp. SAI-117]